MTKWKWYNISKMFRSEVDGNRMEYLNKLTALECAIMGIQPELNHEGYIEFDSDKMYDNNRNRNPLWDFEDVLEKAMKFNKTKPEEIK